MAQLAITRSVLESVRDNKQAWRVVQDGLKCSQIGLLCVAGGFATMTLLSFIAVQYATPLVAGIVTVIGSIAILVGLAFLAVGLVQCLLVPHSPSRTLLLAGLLVGMYASHWATVDIFNGIDRAVAMRNNDIDLGKLVVERVRTAQMKTLFLSSTANILVTGFLMSLATFLGAPEGVKRVQTLWKVQFGGLFALVGLTLLLQNLAVWLDLQFLTGLLSLLLATFFVVGLFWFQSTIFKGAEDDLKKVLEFHDQKLQAAKKAAKTPA